MRPNFLRRLLPKEDWILLVVLAIVATLLGFALLAGQVVHGRTQAFDELVLTSLRRVEDPTVPIGPRWLEDTAIDVTALGSGVVLVIVMIAVLGFLGITRRWGLMALALASVGGGWLLSFGLKELFGRTRPTIVPHLQHVSSPSFPSGHSMLSAVVYLTLGVLLARTTTHWRVRLYFITVAIFLSFIVGATRVYLGVHYPTDVMAGWLAGSCWAVLCALVAYSLQRRGYASPPAPEPVVSG